MSGARKAILEVLKGSSGAMSPTDVVAETGAKPGNVRFLLRKMVEDGTVMKAERGRYLLDLSTPTHHATNLATPSADMHPCPSPSIPMPPPLPMAATNGAPSLSTLPPLPM